VNEVVDKTMWVMKDAGESLNKLGS